MSNFIIQEMSFEPYFFMSGFLFHFFMVVCVYSALANTHPHAHLCMHQK